ncbi:MAG: hypothetical protein RML95_03590 [Anaerolineae bacterium]|nr:hypothetical protein [Anaerolineae bacterium]MDW8298399.1 hypothetical protein [Anaerolineae bacterium]
MVRLGTFILLIAAAIALSAVGMRGTEQARSTVGVSVFFMALGLAIVFLGQVFSFIDSLFKTDTSLQPRRRSEERLQPSRELHSQAQSAKYAHDDDEHELRPRVVPKEVAQRAMQRARSRPENWLLSLEDIGVLAYHGDDTPDVVRLNPVASDTTHLRPFAVVRLPFEQSKSAIRFELLDEHGVRHFLANEQHALREGNNFIAPRTYMPMLRKRTSGIWRLRLSIGNRLLAEHEFSIEAWAATPVRNALADDGEVDQWLASAILEQGRQGSGMSLDELLADQSDKHQSSNRLR